MIFPGIAHIIPHILYLAVNGKIVIHRRKREGLPPAESALRKALLGSPGSSDPTAGGAASVIARRVCLRLPRANAGGTAEDLMLSSQRMDEGVFCYVN